MENSSEMKEKAIYLKLKEELNKSKFHSDLTNRAKKVKDTVRVMKNNFKLNFNSISYPPKNIIEEINPQNESVNCLFKKIHNEKSHFYDSKSPKNTKTYKEKSKKLNIPKSEIRHFPFSSSAKKIMDQTIGCRIIECTEYITYVSLENKNLYEVKLDSYLKNKLHITSINMRKNLICQIPLNIDAFIKLTEIRMDNNKLTSIPSSIGNLKLLTFLSISNNLINQLPIEIRNLDKLSILSLHDNLFTEFPLVFTELKLTELYLHNNKISYLPYDLCKLVHLREFSFDWIIFIEPSKLLSDRSGSNNLSNLRNYLFCLNSQSQLKISNEFKTQSQLKKLDQEFKRKKNKESIPWVDVKNTNSSFSTFKPLNNRQGISLSLLKVEKNSFSSKQKLKEGSKETRKPQEVSSNYS